MGDGKAVTAPQITGFPDKDNIAVGIVKGARKERRWGTSLPSTNDGLAAGGGLYIVGSGRLSPSRQKIEKQPQAKKIEQVERNG